MGLINRHSHNWRAPSCILPRLRETALNDSVGTLLGKAGQMGVGWYQPFMGVGKKQLQEALGFNDLNRSDHSDDAFFVTRSCVAPARFSSSHAICDISTRTAVVWSLDSQSIAPLPLPGHSYCGWASEILHHQFGMVFQPIQNHGMFAIYPLVN